MQEIFDACRHLLILMWICCFFPTIYVYGSNLMMNEHSITPSTTADIEIRAYRLQQYEFNGRDYGSKSWRIFYEAVSLNSTKIRKCVILKWRDLINRDVASSVGAAIGALLIVIPSDLDALTDMERQVSFLFSCLMVLF